MSLLMNRIKRGFWAGKPEKQENDATFAPLTEEQKEFFKYNKWVQIQDSNGVYYRLDRGYWNYEQWLEDPEKRTFIMPLAIQPKTKVCNCCGHEI
jgi:hypothetical protein